MIISSAPNDASASVAAANGSSSPTVPRASTPAPRNAPSERSSRRSASSRGPSMSEARCCSREPARAGQTSSSSVRRLPAVRLAISASSAFPSIVWLATTRMRWASRSAGATSTSSGNEPRERIQIAPSPTPISTAAASAPQAASVSAARTVTRTAPATTTTTPRKTSDSERTGLCMRGSSRWLVAEATYHRRSPGRRRDQSMTTFFDLSGRQSYVVDSYWLTLA